ncbi:hypothetical protein thsrh120_32450 [Rhizobium sp. No.120]
MRVSQKAVAKTLQCSFLLNPTGEKSIVPLSPLQLLDLVELPFGKNHRHDLGGFLLRKCIETFDIDADAAAATDRQRNSAPCVRYIEVDVGVITQVGSAGMGNRKTKCLRCTIKPIAENVSTEDPSGNEKAPRRA